MKFMKKYLFQIILAAALTLGFRFTAMAAQIHGNVDEIHEDSISGWAWDAEPPDVPLTVQVSVTDRSGNLVFQQTAEASIQRDDVSASGYGSGACGFLVPVDWTGLPDGSGGNGISVSVASSLFSLGPHSVQLIFILIFVFSSRHKITSFYLI